MAPKKKSIFSSIDPDAAVLFRGNPQESHEWTNIQVNTQASHHISICKVLTSFQSADSQGMCKQCLNALCSSLLDAALDMAKADPHRMHGPGTPIAIKYKCGRNCESEPGCTLGFAQCDKSWEYGTPYVQCHACTIAAKECHPVRINDIYIPPLLVADL
jgi:hypothetical protein